MSIPLSQFIPPSTSPLCLQVHSFWLHLYCCLLCKDLDHPALWHSDFRPLLYHTYHLYLTFPFHYTKLPLTHWSSVLPELVWLEKSMLVFFKLKQRPMLRETDKEGSACFKKVWRITIQICKTHALGGGYWLCKRILDFAKEPLEDCLKALLHWKSFGLPTLIAAMKLKDAYSLEGKLWPT